MVNLNSVEGIESLIEKRTKPLEKQIKELKKIVKALKKAINYTHCCEAVCDCEFERIDSKRIQCIKCEMIHSRDS